MSEHLEQTIEHLRKLIAEQQLRLNERTQMLAYILPHIENMAHNEDYIAFEFCEKFEKYIEKFKEEYNREMGLN